MTKTPRLDPRRPLVLDTRELGRRPGSMRRVSRTVPAPEHLANGMASVAPGSDLALDLRLESVVEGVLVSGEVSATMSGECGRCLRPLTAPLSAGLQELYAYPDEPARGRHAPPPAPEEDEDDLPRLVEDLLDLEPVVRDALVLEIPLTPLCAPDCPGLCPGCGARLDEVEPGHNHDVVDPRWAALAQIQTEQE